MNLQSGVFEWATFGKKLPHLWLLVLFNKLQLIFTKLLFGSHKHASLNVIVLDIQALFTTSTFRWLAIIYINHCSHCKPYSQNPSVLLLVKKLILIYLLHTCWHHEFEMTGSAFSWMKTIIQILRDFKPILNLNDLYRWACARGKNYMVKNWPRLIGEYIRYHPNLALNMLSNLVMHMV